jgi:hypothetical protein
MQKMSDMEERKVLAAGEITQKQLEYFKIRDSETQRGLVSAINELSAAIVEAYTRCNGIEADFNG